MILVMITTFYTSRIILETLGVEDYGIYNIVGGIVISFSIVSSALSGAISRFITFELGKSPNGNVKKVFTTSLFIQIGISIIIFFLGEFIGIYFLNTHINIPEIRLSAANFIFHTSLLTLVIRLIYVPFEALIISHEKMSAYAIFGLVEVFLQLLVVFLIKIISFDKLETYGFMLMCITFTLLTMNIIFCISNFKDALGMPHYNKTTFSQMLSFASWNFIGTSAGIFKQNGVDIIVNIFSGVTINAARGIALQVNTAITKFNQSLITAIQPQIIKSYATNDYNRYFFLVQQGARFSFYLILFLSLPVILEVDQILSFWLKLVPPSASDFVTLQLINALIISLSQTLITAILATGRIRNYQLTVGILAMLNLPLSYLFLKLGYPIYITYIISIIIECCCLGLRLYYFKTLSSLPITPFLKNVIANVFCVSCCAIICPLLLIYNMEESVTRFFLVVGVSILTTSASIYGIGLNNSEKQLIKQQIKEKMNI